MKSWYDRLRYSLAARLMLLFLAVGIVILVILNLTIGLALRHQFDRNLRPHLVQYLRFVQQELGDPPDVQRAEELAERVGIEIHIRGPEVNWSSAAETWSPDEIRFRRPPRHRRGGPAPPPHLRRFAIGDYRDRLVLRTLLGRHVAYLSIPKKSGPRHAIWVLLTSMAGVLIALYLMYRMIRWLFRPVQTIKDAVMHFGEGDLNQRIHIERKDELADLGHSINKMADDIQQMLEAKRQLLLAASHELRSPITRARVSTELLEDSKLKQNLVRDLTEMDTLVLEILETEKLNTRHAVLNRSPVSIHQMINTILEQYFSERNISLQLPDGDCYVMVDGARIKLLVLNLLSNALHHNEDASFPPKLSIQIDTTRLIIRVHDHGRGIAPHELPHISEPFYRADLSRTRQTGGYGLGLYLCRLIAEAHGGHLSIDSELGKGTTVSAVIPIKVDEKAKKPRRS